MLMGRGMALLFLAVAGSAHATSAQPDLSGFVPSGWTLVSSAAGELTGDTLADAILVVQASDPAKLIRNDRLGTPILDTNPRRLIVLQGSGKSFRQVASSDHVIPPQGDVESSCLADPLEDGETKIERGQLRIRLNYWLSCGGWGVTVRSYKFRFEQGRLRLIGFDRLDYARNSGQGEERSVDFLRGRIKHTSDVTVIGEGAGARPKVRWLRTRPERLYLESLAIAACPLADPPPDWC